MRFLRVGDEVTTISKVTVKITGVISTKGGQGFVYLVNYGGQQKVLKWYKSTYLDNLRKHTTRCDWRGHIKDFDAPDESSDKTISSIDAFYNNLLYNALNRPHGIGPSFIWPLDITEWDRGPDSSFGYIMDVIDTKKYKELSEYYTFNTRFKSRHAMLTCCLNIVKEFRQLHLSGLSYQDMNDGNIFADPETGNILIADNDNVISNKKNLGVGGKDRYMAPEIVLGSAPDKNSDRFSMALILFRIMMGGQHPFEGVYSEANNEKTVYGMDPVFIFDEKDKRNAPVPHKHKNAMIMWPQYPKYIQSLFRSVFTTNIIDSGKKIKHPTTGKQVKLYTDGNKATRPIEEMWIQALIRLRGEMVDCPNCKGAPVFLNVNEYVVCPNCRSKIVVPCKLKCGNNIIPFVPGITIYHCQVDMTVRDFSQKAIMLLSNNVSKKLGLGNVSKETWIVTYPNGTRLTIPPQGIAEFQIGMKITIGSANIEVIR